ncbi:hypothetical protein ACF06X_23950 [Streptomyces sp. NPDC015346]|uniref:hypothetical protein n=1 Tax=Streptomyces sp. NPDC015346 TaxID=3364954 RepID=UPI0036FEB3B4
MSETCYVLDSEGLSRAAQRDRAMARRVVQAHQLGIRVVTSSMTLVEAYHDKIPYAAWRWTLSRIVVEPVTQDVAEAAITLLKGAGLHGHKYAIDAALAVIAGRQRGRVTVFTSDEDDMRQLCAPAVRVQAV